MTARVRVTDYPASGQLAVWLLRDVDGSRFIDRPDSHHRDLTEPVEPGTQPGPSLLLSEDMGRALLDALTAHYRPDTTIDARTLRADRDREAGRVDVLISALVDVHRTSVEADKLRIQHLMDGVRP